MTFYSLKSWRPKTSEFTGIILKWSTKNEEIISETGKVTRPSFSEGDKKVTVKVDYGNAETYYQYFNPWL